MRGSPRSQLIAPVAIRPIPAHAGEPCSEIAASTTSRAYPRACGGAGQESTDDSVAGGLSPRMRGSRRIAEVCDGLPGPIPAHAGEPHRDQMPSAVTAAYPRACGGADVGTADVALEKGLSPRMRGSPRQIRRPPPPPWAYPRACGGAAWARDALMKIWGLSPRMRGSPPSRAQPCAPQGPIPAHAGEPVVRRGRTAARRAYPRACGGAAASISANTSRTGLSPRMRGSHAFLLLPSAARGPIPAHAGEPSCPSAWTSMTRAYPRACGGAGERARPSGASRGLSPRMRGSPGRRIAGGASLRPIPAHAGEPLSPLCRSTRSRAYPRACGGARETEHKRVLSEGLSPRMRGSRERGG